MKRLISLLAGFVIVGFFIFPLPSSRMNARAAQSDTPKYIFLFMADGAGIPQMEITRMYSRVVLNEGLTIPDKIMKEGSLGLVTTHPADLLSTDSAAAATALAGGCKAKNGSLGICADGSIPSTVTEIAKQKNMRVGLVTTAQIYDASPAAFIAHVPTRRSYTAILDRYLAFAPDLLLGGGRDQFLPRTQPGGARDDETDFITAFKQKGYLLVSTRQELEHAARGKVLGLFSVSDMSFELDRDPKVQPSLSEMTNAAIRLLTSGNNNGFFAFIEDENTDSAGHLSDIASVIHDYREFDRAVAVAYEFYRKHPRETLIVVTSDHETGGLAFTYALKDLSSTRAANQIVGTPDDLKKISAITISLRKASEILGPNPTPAAVDKLMADYFKGFTMAPEFRDAIVKRQPISRTLFLDPAAHALGMMIANNTQAYWLTSGHTNGPVFVAALGPGSEQFRGYQDNTDIGKNLKALVAGSRLH
jgi:alkaline phosphatase